MRNAGDVAREIVGNAGWRKRFEDLKAQESKATRLEIVDRRVAYRCDCEETDIRVKTASNGNKMYANQCVDCGSRVGDWLKAYKIPSKDTLPEWDDDAGDKWREKCQGRLTPSTPPQGGARWQALYTEYRRSPEWKRIRNHILARGRCEGCMESRSEVAHHLTYDRVGWEMGLDLAALCHPCHARIHGLPE